MANPTHLSIFFTRTIRVRREHILGEQTGEDGNLMLVVRHGETRKIQWGVAKDLIVAESALEDKGSNREKIDSLKAEFKAEDAKEAKTDREAKEAHQKLQKAA